MAAVIVVEYECPHCGRFDYLEEREAQEQRDCPTCGQDAPYVISAPAIKPNYASVTTGRDVSERPKDFVSTSLIADGMSNTEFKARLSKARKERLRKHVRSKLG